METGDETGGISGVANGFRPPALGEGWYICRTCKHRFLNRRYGLLSEVIGRLFVKCPECGSLKTERDTKWVY